jgi:Na+-translocating ferredoxin:NAD+ oxidoreductase subunit G
VKVKLRDLVKPSIVLLLICFVVTAALAATYLGTRDTIDERGRLDAESARKEVLAAAESFKPVEDLAALINGKPELEKVKEAYIALSGDAVVGYVFSTTTKGYGGNIKITVGVDTKGSVSGVKIGDNTETPGLGTKAAEKPFISQFDNLLPQEPLKVVKNSKTKPEEINAVSGATITSKAVVGAVQAALDMTAELGKKEGGQK